MNLTDLPPEVLTFILSYLKGKDLARISLSCTLLRDLSNSGILWQQRCLKEFKFTDVEGWSCSFREVYSKVLNNYGFLLGLKRRRTDCYGGLVHITYEKGRIVAYEYFGKKDIRDNLERIRLFSISFVDGNVNVTWYRRHLDVDVTCTIEKEDVNGDSFHVQLGDSSHPDRGQIEEVLRRFRAECDLRGMHGMNSLTDQRFKEIVQSKQVFERLRMPAITGTFGSQFPIGPGLFKGMYSALLLLTYDMEKQKALASKISGDSNVPAGEVSIEVNLQKPMVLTAEQQQSHASIRALNPDDPPPILGEDCDTFRQPFHDPTNFGQTDGFDPPTFCLCRYHALGTVSPTGYTDPQQIPVHFMVFNEEMFGVMWIGLHHFSLYVKVKEQFETYER
ncbi:F-box only protein 31-like [Mya arenaria]|uniref:F-box only protein 31-like n=1 Tax=Mya arenaria TaxID=6604 RepID=UPI0022E6C2AC|nr:F-box only protein 31-like [Mya arenaria]